MSQTCPACLWISDDDAEECDRCGAPFKPQPAAVIRPRAIFGIGQSILAVIAIAILGAIIAQRFGIQPASLPSAIKAALQAVYTWLLGPNEYFKPYLVGMIVASLFVWLLLWIAAKMR
ncbi:MAG: hypothetical protein AAB261_03380 [Chloroflexota bacterium]